MTNDKLDTWLLTTIVGKSLFSALGLMCIIGGVHFGSMFIAQGWRSVRTREWWWLDPTKVWARGWLAILVGAYGMFVGVYLAAGVPVGIFLIAYAWGWRPTLSW
jgi:hypothetical protein